MANFFLCTCLFRVTLPLFLLVAIIFRPCVISGLYLIFLFVLPWVPIPTEESMKGSSALYLKILMCFSILTTLLQLIFQIVLIALPPYAHFLENCNILEKSLRHVGFIKLNDVPIVTAFTWISPEVIVLVSTGIVYLACSKLTTTDDLEDGLQHVTTVSKPKKHLIKIATAVGKYLALLSLCLAGILRPSIPGGIYFLLFLSISTWWATYKNLHRGFAILLRFTLGFVILHFTALYAYQLQWMQELLEENSPYARYFGLTPLMKVSCDDPRVMKWVDAEWATYLNPIMLLWLYYLITLETTLLLMPQVKKKEPRIKTSERTPLMRGVSQSKYTSHQSRHHIAKKSTVFKAKSGVISVTAGGLDDIPLDVLETIEDEEAQISVIDHVLYALEYIVQYLIRSSYIITNIIMMTWSITFHSWLTFALLLWANILWIVPKQRQSMLRCSPLLVFYAWFLLLSGYIYSMNLTDEELPRNIGDVDLALIGFVKVTELPCKYLLVKCLYTSMFWITLRQFMKERMEARERSALSGLAAPLHISVGTATGVPEDVEKENETLKYIGGLLRDLLMRFWICIVAITLFTVAITGERMTGFRIIYMALFLIFILTFQISFRLWKRLMFGFWLTVILFSMLFLILVYTYQFPNIQRYWTEYLHVSKQQQQDIGLENYEPKQLFVRLVTPTFFVIISVIQLHYFHSNLMELYELRTSTIALSNSTSKVGEVPDTNSNGSGGENPESLSKFDITEAGTTSYEQMKASLQQFMKYVNRVVNVVYLYLELHLHKIILLVAMCLCVFDKCAIYVLIVALIVLTFVVGRALYRTAIFTISITASLTLLARMVYQIQYINHDKWNVTCVNIINTTLNYSFNFNDAEWLGGFKKTDSITTFPYLVRWNIIILLSITIWSLVLTRQNFYHFAKGRCEKARLVMFKNITRSDADKDIRHCLKYLVNYGYYKFGTEICFIATVAVIGLRLDLYACMYAIWLIILVFLKRRVLAKIWPVYLMFIAILIPTEYAMVVGLPPSFCTVYPWDNDDLFRKLQEWAFLTDTYNILPRNKLVYDFILLLLVARQALIFRIEAKYTTSEYPGGSNKSIIHQADQQGFVNPIPDYITYSRSYLDIFKRAIFLSNMWITLAFVFLAGTNRVNVFSIGYLIGSFVFLWLGSDLYLRPISSIILSWNWLLGYNVVVIIVKAILELAGCLFIDALKLHSCWFVQLMALGCSSRAYDTSTDDASGKKCDVPIENIGLAWDCLCFTFILLQRRIFQSYYFFHVVDETKATTILASRGADLIEDRRSKKIKQQEEEEHTILEKIRKKMDRIKANQQRIQGPYIKETNNHFVAIRSGDYYMFDEMDDDEEDLLEEGPASDEDFTTLKRGATISQIEVDGKPELLSKELEPVPGTSKDQDISELSPPREPTVVEKIVYNIQFVWSFIECSMVSLTIMLNKYSSDHRYITKVLNKEKKILKEKTNYSNGLRVGRARIWHPSSSYQTLIRQSLPDGNIVYDDDAGEMSSADQPPTIKFLLAMWNLALSHTKMLCYVMIFLNQINSASFLSLPLPLMVFFWGTLTMHRPSKTFWVTIIAYTEVIVLIKCIFQFEILPWNLKQSVSPFYPPRIIGVEKKHLYALWDLLLLLAIFFHRYMLKCLGLWKSTFAPAVILPDGDYMISEGELQAMDDPETLKRIAERSSCSKDTEQEEDAEDELEDLTLKVKTDAISSATKFPLTFGMTIKQYAGEIKLFFKELMDPSIRLADDVYSYMFLCDFFNFFVILIGYSSFGPYQSDEGVSEYLADNRVPVLFLLMLIIQFALIIIDRGIFLRKQIFGKTIFQVLQIILLHIWLFILYPLFTDRAFNSVIAPQIYYIVKCFYLLISAYQIRSGYPTRILGNFLCKGYNYLNYFLFKAFLLIPFLYELRVIMDWMWTDTSMTVFDWLKMEDIFAHIYQVKCSRFIEGLYPAPRGVKKSAIIKYLTGASVLGIMIVIIWFPLVFFSLGNAVGKSNAPKDVTLDLRIGPYQPIFQMTAQSNSIFQFNNIDLQNTMSVYDQTKSAVTFISNYEASDIAAIKFSTDSATIWNISPPDRKRMIDEIANSSVLNIRLGYQISHDTSSKEDAGIIKGEVTLDLPKMVAGAPNPLRVLLSTVLSTENTGIQIPLPHLFPKFLKVTNKGIAKDVSVLMHNVGSPRDAWLRNITVEHEIEKSAEHVMEWWVVREVMNDSNYVDFLQKLPYADNRYLVMYTFNDKIFPATLSFITAGGIIGVYTTIVLVAGRLLRGFMSGSCFKIMFEDLPNVDRILQLCYDVYLVRESRELTLEEDLFAKLIFLFRSPETLIKWTRPKEESNEDDDEGEEQAQPQ